MFEKKIRTHKRLERMPVLMRQYNVQIFKVNLTVKQAKHTNITVTIIIRKMGNTPSPDHHLGAVSSTRLFHKTPIKKDILFNLKCVLILDPYKLKKPEPCCSLPLPIPPTHTSMCRIQTQWLISSWI